MKPFEMTFLALTLWREASGEGKDGMKAVGSVIRNRTNTVGQGFGRSCYQECVRYPQFTSMTVAGDPGTLRWPVSTDQSWQDALEIAQDLFGPTDDPTNGALYYFNPATATSSWFRNNIVLSPNYEVSAHIGKHVFYRKKVNPA